MTLRLFYAPGACSLAPQVALHWIGAPFEALPVKYGSPELVAVNPAGAVPALDTGEEWTLTQAGASLHYLARRFPKAELGAKPFLRDTCNRPPPCRRQPARGASGPDHTPSYAAMTASTPT